MIKDYQKDCKTLGYIIEYIKKIYAHPDWRFEKFELRGVDPFGGTARLKWDRKDIKPKLQ